MNRVIKRDLEEKWTDDHCNRWKIFKRKTTSYKETLCRAKKSTKSCPILMKNVIHKVLLFISINGKIAKQFFFFFFLLLQTCLSLSKKQKLSKFRINYREALQFSIEFFADSINATPSLLRINFSIIYLIRPKIWSIDWCEHTSA